MRTTPKPSGCPDRTAWCQFHTGQTDLPALHDLAEHLDGCASCQAVVETLAGSEDELVAKLREGAAVDYYQAEPEYQAAVDRVQALVPGAEFTRPVPDRVGGYRLLGMVGRGGMGAVYRAWHLQLGREVAVK
jgi:hypothetical protein